MLSTDELDLLLQRIDGHLQSPEFINEQLLQEDATSYLKICQEVNRKLLEASRLIDRGLRDDALKLMGNDSEVLTAFEKIDFPYRDEWCDLLDIYGIAAPPKLNIDAAAKVNQTFSVLGDLHGLLKNHRLYALARAPLSARIGVLHSLSLKDDLNPIWDTDLAAFKKVRLQQIGREIERAVESENYQQLQDLKTEMDGPVYTGVIDPKLLAIANTALAARTQRERIEVVKATCEELQSAYSECDVPRGFEVSDRLEELMSEANVDSSSPIYEEIEPALNWVQSQRNAIAEEKRDRSLIAALESALETAQTPQPIEQAYQRALSIGSRLPQALQRRAIERLDSFQLAAKRRMMLIGGSTAAALLVIAGLLGFWIYSSQREAAAVAFEKTLEQLLAQEKADEVESLIQKQQAHIQSRPVIQASMTKVTSLRTAETNRQSEFEAVLKEFDQDPSPQATIDLIRKLQGLAKTVGDKLKVNEQEKIAEKKRLALASKKQEELMQQFKAFEKSVEDILDRTTNPIELIGQLRSEKLEITKFGNQGVNGSNSVLDMAKQLAKRVDTEVARIEAEMKAEQGISDITSAVGNAKEFEDALSDFATKNPSLPLSTSLDVPQRMAEFNINSQWIDLALDPVVDSPIQSSSIASKKWLDKYEAVSTGNTKHCLASMVNPVEPLLKKQANVSQAISDLTSLSESRLLDKMYIYPHIGARFYSWDAPSESKRNISYISDFSFAELEKEFSGNFKDVILLNVKVAGHSEFGGKLRNLLGKTKEATFTTSCFSVLDELNKIPSDRIDPIFKLFLYRRLLEKMIPASEPLSLGFGDFGQDLSDDTLIDWDTNWLSVETKNPELNQNREKAESILVRLSGQWDSLKKQTGDAYKKCSKGETSTLEWVGWVGLQGGKKAGYVKTIDANRKLIAVAYDGERSTLVNLGVQQNKVFALPNESQPILVGTPIYALIPPN